VSTLADEKSPVVETQDLCKRFGTTVAVDRLSLRVPQAGVFGLLGPNGSGKTTLLSMLLGLIRPTSGSIRIFGIQAVGENRDTLQRIGATVESPAFYPYLSGRDNLQFFQGIGRRGHLEDVDRLLELVELSARADGKFHTYSLGMKQRLAIAYALMGDPELVFLDEPTNGLDPAGVVQMRELIERLGAGGQTVILSSHLLHEVEQVCDYVAIVAHGKLVAQGKVEELLRHGDEIRLKTTDDTKARTVLGAMSWIGGIRVEDGSIIVGAPPARAWEVTKALAQQGIFVAVLEPLEDSLERYFLHVTGEDDGIGAKQ
jgi:ABC-2 type transport system ATP-binding protein